MLVQSITDYGVDSKVVERKRKERYATKWISPLIMTTPSGKSQQFR
jgi:hypothetical protein